MYENAKYIKDTTGNVFIIQVDIDGVTSFVPLDANNTDYGQMKDLIESGELIVAPAEG